MTAPIQAAYRQQLNDLAKAIDVILNGDERPKRLGFCLLMAEFGKIDGGRVNYISNGDRADMIAMVKEWLARAEGRYSEQEGRA